MLHYRSRLYSRKKSQSSLYMGETVALDMAEHEDHDDAILFHRDVTTTVQAGLDISSSSGHLFPPPILKTVETLAHPDYTMGVITELLYYEVDPGVWMPYYAKIFLGGRRPLAVVFAPAVREIFGLTLGFYPHAVDSTLIHGMWTVCAMEENQMAHEGIEHFERRVPSAGSIVKVWHSERNMIKAINESVRALSRNRDNLNDILIHSVTGNLYTPVSDIPLSLRSRLPIRNRFIDKTVIRNHASYMTDMSPVKVHRDIPTEPYSHRYRDVFYALDMFPLTDIDLVVTVDSRGQFRNVRVDWAIDRNITLSNVLCIEDVLEGHIRSILDKLSDCILQTNFAFGSSLSTLNELYGSSLLHVALVKSQDEIIQIRIYDDDHRIVFAMTVPSAIVKLTDTMLTCCG